MWVGTQPDPLQMEGVRCASNQRLGLNSSFLDVFVGFLGVVWAVGRMVEWGSFNFMLLL